MLSSTSLMTMTLPLLRWSPVRLKQPPLLSNMLLSAVALVKAVRLAALSGPLTGGLRLLLRSPLVVSRSRLPSLPPLPLLVAMVSLRLFVKGVGWLVVMWLGALVGGTLVLATCLPLVRRPRLWVRCRAALGPMRRPLLLRRLMRALCLLCVGRAQRSASRATTFPITCG